MQISEREKRANAFHIHEQAIRTFSTTGRLNFLDFDPNRIFIWRNPAASVIRIHLGELCAKEQDLRRVIDPKQKRDKRAGRSVRRSGVPACKIEANRPLTEGKEKCRESGARPDIAPLNFGIGKELENTREKENDDAQIKDPISRQRNDDSARQDGLHIMAETLEDTLNGEGDEQKEANAADHSKGKKALA